MGRGDSILTYLYLHLGTSQPLQPRLSLSFPAWIDYTSLTRICTGDLLSSTSRGRCTGLGRMGVSG